MKSKNVQCTVSTAEIDVVNLISCVLALRCMILSDEVLRCVSCGCGVFLRVQNTISYDEKSIGVNRRIV